MTTDCKFWRKVFSDDFYLALEISFARRSLVSNESKYRESLEYRMFMAENPEVVKNENF